MTNMTILEQLQALHAADSANESTSYDYDYNSKLREILNGAG